MVYFHSPDFKISLEEVNQEKYFDEENEERYHYNGTEFYVLRYYAHDVEFGFEMVKLQSPENYRLNKKVVRNFFSFLKGPILLVSILFFGNVPIIHAVNDPIFVSCPKVVQKKEYRALEREEKINYHLSEIRQTNSPTLISKHTKKLKKLGYIYVPNGLKKELIERERKERKKFEQIIRNEQRRQEFFKLFAHLEMGLPIIQKKKPSIDSIENIKDFPPELRGIFNPPKRWIPEVIKPEIVRTYSVKIIIHKRVLVDKMARSYADYFSKNMPFPTFVYLIKANVGWEFSPIYNKDRDISVSFPEKKNTLKKIESQKIEMEKEKKELSLDVLLENRHTENNPKS